MCLFLGHGVLWLPPLQDGYTALMLASGYGHVECVNVLLDRGAQANLQDKVSTVPD